MPKSKKQRQSPQDPQDPQDSAETGDVDTGLLPEPEPNGHAEPSEAVETVVEEPAQVQLTIKGSDKSARAAAKRFGGESAKPPPVATPANDAEPPVDSTDELMADGRNMVLVRRTFPKTVEMSDGTKRRCATKLPDRYDCPTTREKIENDIFTRFGGSEYKCTIHPATTNGEGTVLGFFTIEHPNPDEPPYFPDDPPQERPYDSRADVNTSGQDPHMRETDGLAKLRADAERRLERARVRKEMKELEAEAKRLEEEIDGTEKKPAPVVPVGESDEVKRLRAELAEKERQLSEKKVNDRFDKLESSITALAQSVAALATARPHKEGPDQTMTFILEKMKSDDARMAQLLTAVTAKQSTPAAPPVTLDSTLDTIAKVKSLVAPKEDSSIAEFKNQLIQSAMDRMTGGGDESPGDEEDDMDVVKYGLKQLTPVLKTFVEKKMEQETRESGQEPSKEREKQIYEEAAQKAAQKLAEDMRSQGLQIAVDPTGKLIALPTSQQTKKVTIPPRHPAPGKVVSEQRTAEGVVKQVRIQPADLSKKPAPRVEAPAPVETASKEVDEVKYAEFPGLGEGGAVLKVALPAKPTDVQYDRRQAVNFILDSIRSEIRRGIPKTSPDDSFVVGDALDLLDPEVLDRLSQAETGPQVETLLAEWGDRAKVDEIKAAGSDEAVESWLRRIIKTVGDEFRLSQRR